MKVGTRVILRVGAMVGLCVPGVCVGCRGVESGVGVKAFVAAGMECDCMARCRGEAMSWSDRPQGSRGWGPGISSRVGGAGLTGRNRKGRVGVLRDVTCHVFINLEVHSWPCCFFGL